MQGVRRGWSAVRLHQALLAAALLIPAALFAAAAMQNRSDVLRTGHDTLMRTAAIMHEHARKVFETQELALERVNDRLGDQEWSAIASDDMSAFLRRLKSQLEQVVSIWVADSTGTIRAGSQDWDPAVTIAPRDFFQRQRDGDRGVYLSEPFVGRATTVASFALSRRRSTPGGEFDGTIHVAASPQYFQRFYAEAAPPYAHVAALIRADGFILAMDPPRPGVQRLRPNGVLMTAMAAVPDAGELEAALSLDGVERMWTYRKVGAYPAYVLFGVERGVLLRQWHANLWWYGAFAGAAATTLVGMSALALGRARAEQAALARLRRESTQRQAAEQQLRHAQRLEAVGQLTGGIAHDFNNLMTAILGNLELIQRAVATDRPDAMAKIHRLATTATTAVARGSRLTKSLLAFSRSQPLETEAVDVNALLTEFLDLVRQAVGRRVAIDLQLDPGVPLAWADGGQLEAAVLNLSINARDAMPGGGHLAISTGFARMSAADLAGNAEARPGPFVRVTVEDTGHGMPAEVAAKAFEPFFTTKPIGQGTGLGLSQVFGFVRQLGGHVAIRSAPEEGTAVSLYLPPAPGFEAGAPG